MLMCPKCGKTNNEEKFIESFCADCYEFRIKYPAREEFQKCKNCSLIFFRGEWQRSNARRMNEYIIRKCKGEFSDAELDLDRGFILFSIKKGERIHRIEKQIDIKFVNSVCVDCSRISGGYYEAIVQLRGDEKKVSKYFRTLQNMLRRVTFISKIEEVKGGFDIYSGSSIKTQEILSTLGLNYLISRKLVGRNEGKKVYRVTFAVRL